MMNRCTDSWVVIFKLWTSSRGIFTMVGLVFLWPRRRRKNMDSRFRSGGSAPSINMVDSLGWKLKNAR